METGEEDGKTKEEQKKNTSRRGCCLKEESIEQGGVGKGEDERKVNEEED
jgi:hypothetical protein